MAISKQDILKFLSAHGHAPSGYEEQLLHKFADFVNNPIVETVVDKAVDPILKATLGGNPIAEAVVKDVIDPVIKAVKKPKA